MQGSELIMVFLYTLGCYLCEAMVSLHYTRVRHRHRLGTALFWHCCGCIGGEAEVLLPLVMCCEVADLLWLCAVCKDVL